MKIIFSDHATAQLVRRKIPTKLVIETVEDPESVRKSFRGRKLHQKIFGVKLLEVVTIKEKDALIIVTQYWLEENNL